MKLRSAVALVCVLLLGACTSSKTDEVEAAAAAAASAPAEGVDLVDIPVREPPRVQVEVPGAEPLRPLRLHPAAGTRESMEMSVGMTMSMRNGAQDLPSIPVPTTKTRLSAVLEEVTAEEFTVRHAVDAVEVVPVPGTPPQVLEQVRQSVEPLARYRAVVRMDPRGAVRGGQVELPRDVPALVHQTMQQMTQNLGQLAVPLPAEPVGVGASWTATHELEQNGMKLRQTGRYTLRALEGEHVTLDATIEQELLDPNVEAPGMMGATARVSDFSSSGRGTLELDLDRLMPTTVSLGIDLHMVMDVTVLGQNQHMEMDMGMQMDMRRQD
ncbi:DUF6263 family protein [Paraliomyxa miuraensis]|uniref:DUF6263 family protein n=1 Tax=Paraliomyxa miuraensis TaxID=376150 RepID=UPI00224DA676|nr:DUF6263 family protein [Paraliomyxa miuraensis]MCX4246851.1 DUF6263 family protein [Paraliomyxa miuraensis]